MPTTINSMSSSNAMAYLQKPEGMEAQRPTGTDMRNDGDQDDRATSNVANRPQPTTNMMGQSIGTLLNTSA